MRGGSRYLDVGSMRACGRVLRSIRAHILGVHCLDAQRCLTHRGCKREITYHNVVHSLLPISMSHLRHHAGDNGLSMVRPSLAGPNPLTRIGLCLLSLTLVVHAVGELDGMNSESTAREMRSTQCHCDIRGTIVIINLC